MSEQVFISHSTDDSEIAEQLVNFLEDQGIDCWIAPRDIPPGEDWDEAIIDAIEQCQGMIFLLSENSNQSRQAKREVQLASEESEMWVVPVTLGNVEPNKKFKYYLTSVQWLQIDQPSDTEDMNTILEELKNKLESSSLQREFTTVSMNDDSEDSTILDKEFFKKDLNKLILCFVGMICIGGFGVYFSIASRVHDSYIHLFYLITLSCLVIFTIYSSKLKLNQESDDRYYEKNGVFYFGDEPNITFNLNTFRRLISKINEEFPEDADSTVSEAFRLAGQEAGESFGENFVNKIYPREISDKKMGSINELSLQKRLEAWTDYDR
ncbi:MAG: toll/interleukin-1 receptor domain-containing protein, partial [Flavobacteriales bacterium]